MKNTYLLRSLLITGGLLLIPFGAMQVFSEMNWSMGDFLIMGMLIFFVSMGYQLFTDLIQTQQHRFGVVLAFATAFLLLWINLAVGMIGNESNPANLLYYFVIAVFVVGGALSRLKRISISRVFFITAGVHACVPLIAYLLWKPPLTIGLVQVVGINGIFVLLWLVSGMLLRDAHRA